MQIDILGLRPGQHRMPCPDCAKGRHDTALSVLVRDDGSAVWRCFRCEASGGTRRGRDYRAIVSAAPKRAPEVERAPDARTAAARIWRETIPLAESLGAQYLLGRCCDLPPPDGDLRFHPALWCPEMRCELTALVARVSTVIGNRDVGVHRIWFRPGEIRAVKKMRLGGSKEPVCIRLWPDTTVTMGLGIAEGVETACAASFAFSPIWSCVDAGQLARFPILAGVESLTIFADFDNAGYKAAKTTYFRYSHAGINVTLLRSANVGEDINDMRMKAAGRI